MSTPTFDAIVTVLTDQFDVERERIGPTVPLQDLGLDSLSLMEFVFAVEDHFSVRIPEDQLDPRRAGITLSYLVDAIESAVLQPLTADARAA